MSEGRDLGCFRRLQLCHCFLFDGGRGGCFGEGGRELVLAVLDTSENTNGDECENTEDIHRLSRDKHIRTLYF